MTGADIFFAGAYMAKEVLNLEDLFTVDNEQSGVWFEPKIDGVPCGIEFLVTGTGTDENVANSERYDKAVAEAEDIRDSVERVREKKRLDANRVAEFVKGIRSAGGKEVLYGGKPLEYSVPMIQQLLLKAPLIKAEIVRFAVKTENFIRREKDA